MAESVTVGFRELDVCHGALRLAAGGVRAAAAASAPSLALPGAPDLRAECARLRLETPVLPGAVTAAHRVAAMPLQAFSNGDVISVSGGGTGGSLGFQVGAAVVGDGTNPLRSTPRLSVTSMDGTLLVPSLVLAAGCIQPEKDPFGRDTLVIQHTGGGPRVDLMNPLLSAPVVLSGGSCDALGVASAVVSAIHPDAFACAIYAAGGALGRSAADVLYGYGAEVYGRVEMNASNNPAGEPWPVTLDYVPTVQLSRGPLPGEELAFAASTSAGLAALL